MTSKHLTAGARIGRFLGLAYKKYARSEAKAFQKLPIALAMAIKVAVRAGTVGFLLYFLLLPMLLAALAVALLVGLSRSSIDLHVDFAPSEPELMHGNDGYGLYQDGIRIG
ncbi:DUF3742 family protein [Pseudomonas brenneri]|uniref:DUF3742 family protein n=1 Tax=Pseudomonas brenneri TaxID=129817 RepID=UPI003BA1C632